MKRNKVLPYLVLMLPALLFQSCLKDQDDVFDESSAARMENYLNEAQRVLMSSEEGWALDYYPEKNRVYGGFTYTLKFGKSEVAVTSEVNPDDKETCLYSMKINNGPELSFDTYSPLMHFFATPSSSLYEAHGGDFEFVIDSIGQDVIKFHGKRSQNVMYMRRLTEKAASYQEKVIAMGDDFNLIASDGTIGGKAAHFEYDVAARQVTVTTDGESRTVAYNYTDKGIRLYQPMVINGVAVSELVYSTDKLTLTAEQADLNKGWQNPQTVVDVIGSIGSDDEAFSRMYRNINNLDEFKFVTDADWLTITTNGNDLTISMTPNTTGNVRSTEVYVVNGQYQASFVVTQCEVKDVVGNYMLVYQDAKGKRQIVAATLAAAANGMTFTFKEPASGRTFTFPVAFDQATGSLKIQGGSLGKFDSSSYMIASFLFGDGSYAAWNTNSYMTAPFQHDEKNGTYAFFGGKVEGYDIEALIVWKSAMESPEALSDMQGYYFWLKAPYIVKLKNASPAKSYVNIEKKMSRVKVRSVPASN